MILPRQWFNFAQTNELKNQKSSMAELERYISENIFCYNVHTKGTGNGKA